MSEFWPSHAECLRGAKPGLSIYICINILLYLKPFAHMSIIRLAPPDRRRRFTSQFFLRFSVNFLKFPPLWTTFSYMIKALCVISIWAFINNANTDILSFCPIPSGEKS